MIHGLKYDIWKKSNEPIFFSMGNTTINMILKVQHVKHLYGFWNKLYYPSVFHKIWEGKKEHARKNYFLLRNSEITEIF